MWRLWHMLFGWHYAYVHRSGWASTGIYRVEYAPDGTAFVVNGRYVVFEGDSDVSFRPLTGGAR